MGKTQKYSDDLMLTAVVRYAETHEQKIIITKLCEWASANIEGLEGIRDHHFKQTITVTDPKTKKRKRMPRRAYRKVQEINEARLTTAAVCRNLLMTASDLNKFFALSRSDQIHEILEMRDIVKRLISDKADMSRYNEHLSKDNANLKKELSEALTRIGDAAKTQALLQKKTALLLRLVDETQRKNVLEMIGISDLGLDLDMYSESLHQPSDETFHINDALNKEEQDVADIMKGLDF